MKIFILKVGLLHAAAFGLDCCITKYLKFSSSKLHPFISSQFCRSRVWTQCDWVLCSRSCKHEFQVSVGVMCLSVGRGGESTPKLTPTGRRIQFLAGVRLEPLSPFSVSWWPLSAPRGHSRSLPCGSFYPQSHQWRFFHALNLALNLSDFP